MAEAEVGDDWFGDDPTVNRLQERAAEVTGKEAALYVPTGTMANQIGVRLHVHGSGHLVAATSGAHVASTELMTSAVLSGITFRTGDPGPKAWMTADLARELVEAEDPYDVEVVDLLAVENTVGHAGGTVMPVEELRAIRKVADDNDAADPPGRRADLQRRRRGRRRRDRVHARGRHDDVLRLEGPRRADRLARLRHPRAHPRGPAVEDPVRRGVAAGRHHGRGRPDRARGGSEAAPPGPRAGPPAGGGPSPRSLPGSVDPGTVETNMVYADTEAVGLDPLDTIGRLRDLGVGATFVSGKVRMVTHVDVDDDGLALALDAWRADRRPTDREGDVMGLFTKNYPEEIAARMPPGQRLVKTWPVLHYGPIPKFDGTDWDLEVSGLVEHPFTLSYAELQALPHVTVDADMHCVTGWTTLDNTWEGVSFRTLLETGEADRRGEVGDRALRARLHVEPLAAGHVRRRRAGRMEEPRRGPHGGARLAAATGRAQALRVEEREVADRPGVQREEHARVLGGPRLPHPRRAVRRGALQLPGRPARRAGAVTEGLDLEAYLRGSATRASSTRRSRR